MGTPLIELTQSSSRHAFKGLTRAVNLRVGVDGRVWVADNDARAIFTFDSTGKSLGDVGGDDNLGFMSDFVMLDSAVVVLDTGRTLSRVSLAGNPLVAHREIGYEQALGVLGPDRVLMASSVQWTGPARDGTRPWALARVVSSDGDSLLELGRRAPGKNPFVAHIANFVLPAGSGNGQYVWLAYLNSPDVSLFTSSGRLIRRVERNIPFGWRAIDSSFVPRSGALSPVFDGISYSIASDTAGTAYVLTALGPMAKRSEPTAMGIDMLSKDPLVPVRRFSFTGTATHVAVSPSGSRLYLLDSHRNSVRTFAGPR